MVKRKGATTVEFALILPVFLTLVWIIISIGRIFMVSHVVQLSVQLAARNIAVNDCRQENPVDQAASKQAARDAAIMLIVDQSKLVGVVPTITFTDRARVIGPDTIYDTQVTAVVPYSQFSLLPLNGSYKATYVVPREYP